MQSSRPYVSRSSPAAAKRCAAGAGLDRDPHGRGTIGRAVRCSAASQLICTVMSYRRQTCGSLYSVKHPQFPQRNHFYKGRWDQAVLAAEEALPVAWEIGEWSAVFFSSAWLALAQLKLGQPDKARRVLDRVGPIARTSKDLLRILGLPGDLSPSVAPARLPLPVAATVRPGLSGVRMQFSNQLISLAGGRSELRNVADRTVETAEAYGEDRKQAASSAMDLAIAEAVLGLVPVMLATLREAAERGLAIVEAEPKPRLRRNTAGLRVLLRGLAEAHKVLFGRRPQLRDKVFGRDTPSLFWTKAVIKAVAADLRLIRTPICAPALSSRMPPVCRWQR